MRLVHIAESGALAGRCVLSRLDVGLSGLPRLALRLAFPKLGLNGRAAQRVDRHSRFAGNFNLRRDDRRPRYSLLRQRGRVPAQRLSRLYSRDKAAAFGCEGAKNGPAGSILPVGPFLFADQALM